MSSGVKASDSQWPASIPAPAVMSLGGFGGDSKGSCQGGDKDSDKNKGGVSDKSPANKVEGDSADPDPAADDTASHHQARDLPHKKSSIAALLKTLTRDLTSNLYDQIELLVRFDDLQGWEDSGCKHCVAWMNSELSISPSLAWEYLRVGRELRNLPVLTALFKAGSLGWSKVRQISRVADQENECLLSHVALDAPVSDVERMCREYRWQKEEAEQAASSETARRIACDCSTTILTTRDGEPVDIGRKSRQWPPPMARAIRHRDKHCHFTGCDATQHLQIHHIVRWADGGGTSMENGVCLCSKHHRLVHDGGLRLERVESNQESRDRLFEDQRATAATTCEAERLLRNSRASFDAARSLMPCRQRFTVNKTDPEQTRHAEQVQNDSTRVEHPVTESSPDGCKAGDIARDIARDIAEGTAEVKTAQSGTKNHSHPAPDNACNDDPQRFCIDKLDKSAPSTHY